MGNVTIALDGASEQKLRALARERFGGKKGSMAKVVREALEKAEEGNKKRAWEKLLDRIEKGTYLGGLK
ncbi:MAG: hypothetical protein V1847_02455 [Candidatus Diapherotrites archaeon]